MDHRQTIGELLWVLGYRDVKDPQAFIKESLKKIEDIKEWAYRMSCMYDDCTYLSLKQFDKDGRAHLERLIALVGKWTPPEMEGRP